jgi:hypothetical protein
LPPKAAGRKEFCEDTSLLSDHLGEARTKFVGGLNITSREGFGLPPSALLLGGNFYIALISTPACLLTIHTPISILA